MAQAPRVPRPSAAFRGLPRLSAAFRAAHSMHIPRPFRAFRESRHVPQLPCLTIHDATHGINGWLNRNTTYYSVYYYFGEFLVVLCL